MIDTELGPTWRFICRSWLRSPGTLGFSSYEWLPARVPGHVHLDLMETGVIADPFVALHEVGCQWVDVEAWVYAVDFPFQPTVELPHRVLRFEGLDTVCTIILNGVELGRHDNMFTPLELDVSGHLLAGVNTVEVHFESASDVGATRRRSFLQQEGLAPDLVRFDDRAFIRKAGYMFGWDWGPRLVSAGIWKPVRLIEFASRIVDVHVSQTHLDDGSVRVACDATVEGPGYVVHYLRLGAEATVRLEDGCASVLDAPALWWPRGMGGQSLYELTSLLLPLGAENRVSTRQVTPAEAQRQALDSRTTRFGLRRVELIKEPDAFGESFRFEVNGRRVWCLGANWIPDHSFPSVVTGQRVRQQLLRAADMNMNMLRVWGGGVYESDEFYELCDELGIMVWQDFPFACSYAPDDEAAQDVMRVEATANIRRLRNHASLVVWCGNNENLQMFQNKWDDAARHPSRYYGERIWHETLPQVLAELDPSRPYLPTSPHLGANANADECGDQHNWDVWHGRGDWVFYSDSKARFPSEYGFASAPCPPAWDAMFSERGAYGSRQVRDPIARWHDKTKKGYQTFLDFVELHYPRAENLREWTYTSQLNQRDALRHAVEHYRRSPFAGGSLIWQLNDCWPVQSWAVMDSTGAYKAAAYELRRLHAPLLAAVEWVGAGPGSQPGCAHPRARIWAIHDNSPSALQDRLHVELRDSMSGAVLHQWNRQLTLEPGERVCAFELSLEGLSLERTLLWVSFGGYRSVRTLCEPKHVLWHRPRWQASRTTEGLLLTADGPVVDAFIEPMDAGALRADTVVGAVHADTVERFNFFNLPGAGSLTLPQLGTTHRLRVITLAGTVELDVE